MINFKRMSYLNIRNSQMLLWLKVKKKKKSAQMAVGGYSLVEQILDQSLHVLGTLLGTRGTDQMQSLGLIEPPVQ